MAKLGSRWVGTKQPRKVPRYSPDRSVESAHWVREPGGGRRRVVKAVTEILYVQMGHEPYGWRNGAKVRKV